MIHKLGATLATLVLIAVATVAPVAAVEPVGTDVDAVAPTPQITDVDGDRLAPAEVTLPLAPDGAVLDLVDEHGHGHGPVALASGVAALSGAPEMVILEDVPAHTHLAVRSRNAGDWSEWTEVVASPDEAPDAADVRNPGVGPLWVGHDSERLEVALLEGEVTEVRIVALRSVDEPVIGSPSYAAATHDTTTTTTSSTTSTTTTTAPDDGSDGSTTTELTDTELFGDGSFIRPRRAWATDAMVWNCTKPPQEADELKAMVVHHTAGTNDYTQADVPKIIRGIWYYHVQTRGWCDVAYNFFADKYGGVWEGRRGGVTKAIIGGHTYGFNTGTTAVAQLGNYQSATTPSTLTKATRRIIGWKLALHGIDADGTTTVTNRSGQTFKGVPDDGEVPTRTVVGHRDLSVHGTSCPGDHTYGTLPHVRERSAHGVHLAAMHRTFLQAFPTPAQYRAWADVADAEGLYGAGVGMARSEAYSGLIIDDLYERVLGRPADDSGKAYWLGVLASGVRVEEVGAHFYGSDEYVDAAGSTEDYVRLLYANLLFREPEPDGLAYWVGLLDGGTPAPAVTKGFYRSLESRRDRVTRLYDRILGRAPDRSGLAFWADELIDTDDVLLAVHLSVSDEFYERATS